MISSYMKARWIMVILMGGEGPFTEMAAIISADFIIQEQMRAKCMIKMEIKFMKKLIKSMID